MKDNKILRKIFDFVESKRGVNSVFWRCCTEIKDFGWRVVTEQQRKNRNNDSFFSVTQLSKVNTFYKISFCTTSMNRLGHIKKTLIKNIEDNLSYPNLEFILLDYNSSDGLEKWVFEKCKKYLDSGRLVYHRTEKPKLFHMANAKNMSHQLATGDIVCGLDADNFTNRNFAYYINFVANQDMNIIGAPVWDDSGAHLSDFGGRMFISKNNFTKLGGYDEQFVGWGYEDLDFKHRAMEEGLKIKKIPLYFLKCIQHSDRLRKKNMPIGIHESRNINKKLFDKKRLLSNN